MCPCDDRTHATEASETASFGILVGTTSAVVFGDCALGSGFAKHSLLYADGRCLSGTIFGICFLPASRTGVQVHYRPICFGWCSISTLCFTRVLQRGFVQRRLKRITDPREC